MKEKPSPSSIKNIDHKFLAQNDSTLTETLFFGDPTSSLGTTPILNVTITRNCYYCYLLRM